MSRKRNVTVAAVQMKCSTNVEENIAKADALVREAAEKGAQIILLPELFERQYFCQERRYEYYEFAKEVNENDAVSADEIKIGDNDTLSAIVASVAEADLLIILSDIQGLYTKDPKSHPDAELIHEVPAFSRELFAIAGGAGTARGTGGMYTKIQAAEICVHSGIDMIIAKSDEKEVLLRIMDGEEIGTLFRGENVHPQLKKRDIIIGTAVKGKIFVDEGCRKALLEKGSSLLPVGIIDVEGAFSDGDTVAVYFEDQELARGISHYSSEDVQKIMGHRTEGLSEALGMAAPYDTVIHRDNLLVMR